MQFRILYISFIKKTGIIGLRVTIKLIEYFSLFQCDVLVLRPCEHGQVPSQIPGDDHHLPAAVADDRRLLHQRVGPQLLSHRAPRQLRHQPNQHQALHGHVLFVLRPLRTILLQGLPRA